MAGSIIYLGTFGPTTGGNVTFTGTVDVGVNPDIIVAVYINDNGTVCNLLKVGGISLLPIRVYGGHLGDESGVFDTVGKTSPSSLSGNQTLELRDQYNSNRYVALYSIWVDGDPQVADTDYGGTAAGGGYLSLDAGANEGVAVIGGEGSQGDTKASTTEDYDNGYARAGHTPLFATGARDVGWEGAGANGYAGAMYTGTIPSYTAEPDAVEVEVEVFTPTITGISVVNEYPRTIEVEVDVFAPVVSVSVPRAIALVGVASEMPDRVMPATGLTTPMLSQVAGIPVFIEAPESALDLDDLTDVDATAPSDGDVIVWDSATSTWVAEPPAPGGVTDHGALTGLSDDDHPQYLLLADVGTVGYWEPVILDGEIVTLDNDIIMQWVEI